MIDFMVFDVDFPLEAKQRVVVNTDAKNEADDQYAIVHAVLTGIIPTHFGTRKSVTSSRTATTRPWLLLRLMDLEQKIRVEVGATQAMPDESTPIDS